jgi:tetratricopeptide (TPR) repeat protein
MAAPVDDARAIRAAATARLAEEGGDAKSALTALVDMATLDPANTGIAGRILEQAVVAGDLRRAVDAASRLWLMGEQRFDARVVLLVDAMRRADWRSARSYAGDTTGNSNVDLNARLISPVLLGWIDVAERGKDPTRHLARFGRMGEDPTPHWIGATMLLLAGETEAARQRATLLRPLNRNSQQVALRLAATFAKRGDLVTADSIRANVAAADGAGALRVQPPALPIDDAQRGSALWFALLGDGFARTPNGSRELGLLFSRAAHWLDPQDGFAQLALVEALAGLDKRKAAIALLEKGGNTLPSGNGFALRRAELLAEQGDHAAAVAAALPGEAALPDDPAWLTRFADIVRRAGDDVLALRTFDALLAAKAGVPDSGPLRAAVLIAKSEVLVRKGDWPTARALLEQALAADPDDPSTLNYAGYSALERRDDVPRAMARIERAWRMDERNPAITDSLGWAYLLTGDVERAVPLLEQAARGEPGNAVINEHLGDALWKSGRKIEARYAWRVAALTAESVMAERLAAKLIDGLTDATLAP